MSSNPVQYTPAQALDWEYYAGAFTGFLAGGSYPGQPPVGYRECFKRTQRYAPLPEEYPEQVAKALQRKEASKRTGSSSGPDVAMSAVAFAAMLQGTKDLASGIMSQAMDQVRVDAAPNGNRFGYRVHGRSIGRGRHVDRAGNNHGNYKKHAVDKPYATKYRGRHRRRRQHRHPGPEDKPQGQLQATDEIQGDAIAVDEPEGLQMVIEAAVEDLANMNLRTGTTEAEDGEVLPPYQAEEEGPIEIR
ncbi:hypothetical protein DFH07DRAFT_966523 [Mycena maculata]|uniref:Uncharacterized protein n=1 Tax=Mycena maculata TaxID=230809 RepID=A0AAD7I8K0_9AGAR|nr:hypothetical protein DFH07DRAFT_966523 [Mycena maculata]